MIEPYYSHAGITIWNCDCREILPSLSNVSHIIADPPYNAGKIYGEGTNDKVGWPEYCDWLLPIISQLEESSNGLVFLFQSVNGMLEISQRKRPRHVCAWEKPMSFSPRMGGSAFIPHWEPCLIYGKPWGEGGRVPDYSLSDVWRFNPSEPNGHPCPKPIPLMKYIINNIDGDTILDPFCGSGSTLIAAKALGRKGIGIEIEEKWAELAAKRLSQEVFDFGS